jgi:GTP pyrophosphokinase
LSIQELYQTLECRFLASRPNASPEPLRAAFEFARDRHKDQLRQCGAPYITHPLEVALILADMQMDVVGLQTALLHDVLEDTSTTVEELRQRFGEEVARCVDGVTKLSKLDLASPEERQAENLRKMFLAMVSDIRVILVKLADRLHNMRTLEGLSPERQQRIAQETVDIYAPIAHRLGMGKIRGELEDLAFRYLDPEAYQEITRELESRRQVNEQALERMKKALEEKLGREHIPARIEARVKRAYSIYQKLKRQRITIDQVYDLLALRIITDSVKNCYAALGVIHNEWPPIMGRIKDFIALPRPNLYQSLHTSVVGLDGLTFEIQIRTEEMHRIAEEGIAAHWKYKEGKGGPAEDDQRIAWLRQLVELQKELRNPSEFMSSLKMDLYPTEEVYTFTPKGRVVVLPRESTPIDFAYAIHTDIGHTCVGAKVNGRMTPLRYQLRNGDVVEILTQPGHMPSKDWLSIVRTARARNKIRHVINATERQKAIEIGQKYLEKEARRLGIQLNRIPRAELERVAADYGCGKIEDLYAALGYGRYSARQVLQKAVPDQCREPATAGDGNVPAAVPASASQQDGDVVIRVNGVDDLLIYRAGCCNPIRGEPIVGFITRGKGIGVHSVNCPNVQNLMYEPERRIDVEWARAATKSFPVKLVVRTEDRPGMLHQLTSVLSAENSNIRSLEARAEDGAKGEGAIIEMTVEIADKRQLEKVSASLRRISGVRDVVRVQ